MARRPDSEIVQGFANRVEAFWDTYTPRDSIGPDTEEWQRFETAFANAIGMRESVMSDVSAVSES